MAAEHNAGDTCRPHQVCFFFNAQRHQLLHGVATAAALARLPGHQVSIVSPSEGHIAYARDLVSRLGGAPITFVHARSAILAAAMQTTGSVVPPKWLGLTVLARWLNGFDAIAVPERTSLLLQRMGVRRPRYIHLDHGAGDRAVGFDRRIRRFDFVLMAGEKHRERLMRERLITPANHAVVGYPKFEAADAVRDSAWRPFDNDLPTVLYNPHFSRLGSWEPCAEQVLNAFARQDRYNLIVAPHVRLLDGDGPRARWGALLDRFDGHPRFHIDRGSDRAIDMSYTTLADVYLGDVSSQVYEFIRNPRPCVFLNPHRVDWRDDENYAHWHFGHVVEQSDGIVAAVDRSIREHPSYLPAQREGFARTFLPSGGSPTAARAIAGYLETVRPKPVPQRRGGLRQTRRPAPRTVIGRLAASVALVTGVIGVAHFAVPTQSEAAFLDRVVASHRTTLLRDAMASQPEARHYDAAEIKRFTGIAMPSLPQGWLVRDVQVYPSTKGDIVQVVVRTSRHERLSLVAMRIDTKAADQPIIERHQGEQIAYWEEGSLAFALVGALPRRELLRLASGLATA